MANPTHYDTLEVSRSASQAEIKQAYRRLAKQFHPDSNRQVASHEQIAGINAAYEVLGDPHRRQSYDRRLTTQAGDRSVGREPDHGYQPDRGRHQRTTAAQKQYQQRQTGRDSDEHLKRWLRQVYQPINRKISQIITPLNAQINALAADPFDDELLQDFQDYLDDCRNGLHSAQTLFRSMPNPPNVAGVAAHLYYCLNQVSDGIDELERFTSSYDEHYLHTGQELFRIAKGLRREAQAAIRAIA